MVLFLLLILHGCNLIDGISMKTLNIYRTYFPDPPGGVQEAIRQICINTNVYDVQNHIYSLSSNPVPSVIKRDEGSVFRAKSWLSPASCDIGGLSSIVLFRKQVRWADLLHYHFPWPFADCLNFFAFKSKPRVLTYHSDIIKQKVLGRLYSPLMWKTLDAMDVIVATSPNYVESSSVLSSSRVINKVRVIPLGIDEQSYPMDGDEGIFKRIGHDKNDSYFLFLGVHRYYKGLMTLIEAARYTKAKIIIAGDDSSSLNLKAMVAYYNLKNIIFTGQVTFSEKISLFKGCLAFVLPSHLRSEAFGVVLIEAAMMGKPMISCEIGTGTSFVNKHNETGYVVSPESPFQLAEAINDLFDNESLAVKMGTSARRRYELLFSGDALGRAYANLYKEIC